MSLSLGAGPAVLAFDVGGTDIKVSLFDEHGGARGLRRTPTPHPGGDIATRLISKLITVAHEMFRENPTIRADAIGLVVPGIVDESRGVAVFSSNLGWRDAPVRDQARVAFGVPVAFGHDVRAAALAEHVLGAATSFRDVVVVTLGTGISSALIIDGHLYSGHGYAGEVGHMRVADSPACGCGSAGCLEAISSASAICRRYGELSGHSVSGAREVLERRSEGDYHAGIVWDEALSALTFALSQVTSVFAPEAIVIGGGLSRAGAVLFDDLRRRLHASLTFHPLPQIVPARFHGNAGLVGSALLARGCA